MSSPLSQAWPRRLPAACRLAAVPLLSVLALVQPAQAQVQRAFQNLSFESPDLVTDGCRVYIADSQVPGWVTNHPAQGTENSGGCEVPAGFAQTAPIIELWRTPRDNGSGGTVIAPSGTQIAELNAAQAARIYQNVCLINGESVAWRFDHRGRGSSTVYDQANMLVGNAIVAQVGTTNTGAYSAPVAMQGTVSANNVAGNTTWVQYSGNFTYTGASGNTSFGFEATTGSTSGNLLDEIQIQVAPFLEFTSAASSTPESASNNVPTLRVNGTVDTAFTVTVRVTGGTATLGTDYLVNGGANTTMTITVPAGSYDGTSSGSLFALPITIVNDTLVESNETIVLAIDTPASPAPFMVKSSSTCGGTGLGTTTYTIIDDDAGLSVAKNAAAPVAVSGAADQFDIAYTITVTNPSTTVATQYALVDTPSFDPDVSVVSASVTRNGGTASTLTGSGPWTLQAQWASLAAGATDTYVLTVRGKVAKGGSTATDACTGAAGHGLYNLATATMQGTPSNTNFAAEACQATPTPVWATLSKILQGRSASTDQAQVRIYGGGIVQTSAATSGTGTTVSTSTVVLPVGTTLQFGEAIKTNGTGADRAPDTYITSISCTNAASGSTTGLPSGAGTSNGTAWYWPELAPAAGDDIACTITNKGAVADLTISKSDGATQMTVGEPSQYQIVVANSGPGAADGAVIKDPAVSGLSCTAVSCAVTSGTAQCPATGSMTVAALQSSSGIAIPTFPANSSLTFTVTCTAQ